MDEKLQREIGRRIRRRRMALGLMQVDLAAMVEMPQEHVSRLERGQFVSINPERLVAIAQALQTTTDYLLGLSDEAGPVENPEVVEAIM